MKLPHEVWEKYRKCGDEELKKDKELGGVLKYVRRCISTELLI